jgi:hypothetical protein
MCEKNRCSMRDVSRVGEHQESLIFFPVPCIGKRCPGKVRAYSSAYNCMKVVNVFADGVMLGMSAYELFAR